MHFVLLGYNAYNRTFVKLLENPVTNGLFLNQTTSILPTDHIYLSFIRYDQLITRSLERSGGASKGIGRRAVSEKR